MQIVKKLTPEGTVFKVLGELDFSNHNEFREILLREDSASNIILDLSGLEFMDSSGAGALLQLAKEFYQRGCSFEITRIPEFIRESMEMIGLFHAMEAMRMKARELPSQSKGGTASCRKYWFKEAQ